jgi:hypothetical protein
VFVQLITETVNYGRNKFYDTGPWRPLLRGSAPSPSFGSNIRLGLKWLTVTNTPAYCDTELITNIKSFKVRAIEANVKK